MGTTANALIVGVDVEDLADRLDSFYCYHLAVMHWSHAVINRLEGQALFLLSDELEEVASEALAAARTIADRVADLGGAVTADPSDFVERAPIDGFSLPETTADPGAIVGYALKQVQTIIVAYGQALDLVRNKDDLTYQLLSGLLAAAATRESEMQAVSGAG